MQCSPLRAYLLLLAKHQYLQVCFMAIARKNIDVVKPSQKQSLSQPLS